MRLYRLAGYDGLAAAYPAAEKVFFLLNRQLVEQPQAKSNTVFAYAKSDMNFPIPLPARLIKALS
jgi:hemoglobin-like flavoprotein